MTKSKKRSSSKKRNGRKNRRKRNDSNLSIVETKEHLTIQDEIEAQLKRQRSKHTADSVDSKISKKTPQNFGEYEFDENTKAYFPKGTISPKNEQKNDGTDMRNEDKTISLERMISRLNMVARTGLPISQIRTAWIDNITTISTNSQRCRALRALWSERLTLHAMTIIPSFRRKFDPLSRNACGWESMIPQLVRSSNNENNTLAFRSPWDIGFKNSLHPSSRTFDIQLHSEISYFPDILTSVDGGAFLRISNSKPRTWREQNYMGNEWKQNILFCAQKGISSIRLSSRNSNGDVDFGCLVTRRSHSIQTFHPRVALESIHNTENSILFPDHIKVNDIVFNPNYWKGDALIAFAPRPNAKQVWVCYDMVNQTAIYAQIGSYFKSDALCVEYQDVNTLIYGHRNGSISLMDTRDTNVQKISYANLKRGSSTNILPLIGGNLILAKKSFGDCQLIDLRKTGKIGEKSSTVIDFKVPTELADPMLSTYCTGIAIDPFEKVVVSPFSDQNRACHFALWSLATGEMIGSKEVKMKSSQGTMRPTLPHCELRSIATSAWIFESEDSGRTHVKRNKNAWSLWFKSWESEQNAPHFMGSIHQLTFPGRM